MSETRKDEGNAGLTHSGPCTACGQTIPATPPAAETGEPCPRCDGRAWKCPACVPDAAAPAPREVSEAMVGAVVDAYHREMGWADADGKAFRFTDGYKRDAAWVRAALSAETGTAT